METREYFFIYNHTILFKSYYVVWKLFWTGQQNILRQRFKSYYVVWKQNVFSLSFYFLRKFKSYYVVWKRGFVPSIFEILFCLNRTM